MRLIDADKFKQQIAGMAIVNGYSAQKVNKMCELIDEQPAAYDVDKVVEQLESESARWQDSGDAYNDEKEKGVAIGFRKAIEVVKGGGVDGN